MTEVIRLLENQNLCLKKLLTSTENFLTGYSDNTSIDASNELSVTNTESIQNLLLQRDKILKIFNLLEIQIESCIQDNSRNLEDHSTFHIQKCLNERQILIQSILNLDDQFTKQLELSKSQIFKKISTFDKNKEIVQKYKSKWMTDLGEQVDGKL